MCLRHDLAGDALNTDEVSEERRCVICQRRAYHHPYACGGCRQRIARHLLEIGELAQILPAALDQHHLDIIDLSYPPRGGAGAPGIHDPNRDQRGKIAVAARLDLWARDWISTLPNIGEHLPAPTVAELTKWLYVRSMTACDEHPAIDDFAAELRAIITDMRNGIDLNLTPVHYKAPCPYCGTQTLQRERGADWIECKKIHPRDESGCGRLWGQDEYGLLARAAIPPDELLDTDEAAIIAGVEARLIRLWVHRGHLVPAMRDQDERPWFRKIEVEDAARRPTRVAAGHTW
jgi:hypothetical protein